MRYLAVATVLALTLAACSRSEESVASAAPAAIPTAPKLIDLSASLEPARREFNAHRGEARFLTLLSPT